MKDSITVTLATISFALTLFILCTFGNTLTINGFAVVAYGLTCLIAPVMVAFVVMYILTRSDKNHLTVK